MELQGCCCVYFTKIKIKMKRIVPFSLYLFGIIEVLINVSSGYSSILLLLVQIGLMATTLIIEKRVGVALFCGFMLVGFGEWVYVLGQDSNPANLYTLSIGGLSVYGLMSILHLLRVAPIVRLNSQQKRFAILCFFSFSVFIIYSFTLSILNDKIHTLLGDIKLFLPIPLFIILFSCLSVESLEGLIRVAVRVVILQLVAGYFVGASFEYGVGYSYIPMSNIGFLVVGFIFSPLIRLSVYERVCYLSVIFYFIVSGDVFFNGKQLLFGFLCFLICFFQIIYGYKRRVRGGAATKIVLVLAMLLLVSVGYYVYMVSTIDPITAYKISQILSVFSLNIDDLLYTRTSVGNLVAEAMTLISVSVDRPFIAIFGAGFGGGVEDKLNALHLWVDKGGYPTDFMVDNYYSKMHLALFDFVLKFGFVATAIAFVYLFRVARTEIYLGVTMLYLFVLLITANKEMAAVWVISLLLLSKMRQKKNFEQGAI